MKFLQRLFPKKVAREPLFFYNTLTKSKDEFTLPSPARYVRMYNCGPTVYGTQHIGNLSMFVFTDILRRVLEYSGYTVKQVINFTDVGHLVSDQDDGEDKMTKGLKREGFELNLENMKLLGEKYAEQFLEDIAKLGIDTTRIIFPRASAYIPAQIAMIKTLEEKGYTYKTKRGVYFDTSRFPSYGALGGIDLEGLKAGARVKQDPEKLHPTDFNLWKHDKKMGWDSPWGKGFPGWHIECSAMIRETLGEKIDIHTGGIEHIPVHHNNEIAQSESATGKRPMSRFWLHRAHLQLEGGKIAKSEGNVVYLSEIIEKGFHPLAFRYLLLGSHYRTPANFSWEALKAAQTAFDKLQELRRSLENEPAGTPPEKWQKTFREHVSDDLDTAGALAVMWDMINDETVSKGDLKAALADFDTVLGISLATAPSIAYEFAKEYVGTDEVPDDIQALFTERETARQKKDYAAADELRVKIEGAGFALEDTAEGTMIVKKRAPTLPPQN